MTFKLSDVCSWGNDRVAVSDLSAETYISTENMLPNKEGVTESSKLPDSIFVRGYRKGDVLLSNIRPYFKKIWQADRDGGCSNDVLVIRAKQELDPAFLYYLLSEDGFFDFTMATATGTKMPRGDKNAIMRYKVPNIDLKNQVRIAEFLSAIDGKIVLNKKINHHLQQIAQAIYKSWFIDYEPFSYKKPLDWKISSLDNLAIITMGQSPDGSSYNENGVGVVFYQGRAEFDFRFPTRRLYTSQPKRLASKGDVLMSVRAPVGDVNVASENCCIGRGLASIRSKDKYQSFILYTLLAQKEKLNQFNNDGTIFGSINKKDLSNLTVVIPSEQVLIKFEKIVRPIDQMIFSNYSENLYLQKTRDQLLSHLISKHI